MEQQSARRPKRAPAVYVVGTWGLQKAPSERENIREASPATLLNIRNWGAANRDLQQQPCCPPPSAAPHFPPHTRTVSQGPFHAGANKSGSYKLKGGAGWIVCSSVRPLFPVFATLGREVAVLRYA